MKLHLFIIAALFAVPVYARAEVSAVSIRVEQTTGVDRTKFTKTQEKALKIFVTNGSGADIHNLSVKYYFFGHDVRDHEAEILDKGESPVSVKARATATVETSAVKAKATEEHLVAGRGGFKSSNKKGSGFNNNAKKVEATGEKLTGYGVQVFDGNKLVADCFSEPSLKELISGRDRK